LPLPNPAFSAQHHDIDCLVIKRHVVEVRFPGAAFTPERRRKSLRQIVHAAN
jgi:hypothetical protein